MRAVLIGHSCDMNTNTQHPITDQQLLKAADLDANEWQVEDRDIYRTVGDQYVLKVNFGKRNKKD